jgi:FO synthase
MNAPLDSRLEATELQRLARAWPLRDLMARARTLTLDGHGNVVSYSRKVFIPLTHLCRDVCYYCTFAHRPHQNQRAYLLPEEVLTIARAGQAAGCREALFTLGDKPELRYAIARKELASLGYATTIDYLIAMCRLVLEETGLLPHVNPGVMTPAEISALRVVSVSQGMMLESAAQRLCDRGGPHFGSPDKQPAVRLETLRSAGAAGVPFTSGILIGIGETREERLDALLALRELHERFGHLQEIIVQNFRAKPGTRMFASEEPAREDLLWTIAVARLVFGASMNIQAPPNLAGDDFGDLLEAGINDWGGVSPVTPDHVNPESPWPAIERLTDETEQHGKWLVERLAVYPSYCLDLDSWEDPALHRRIREAIDAQGFVRDCNWRVGSHAPAPNITQSRRSSCASEITHAIEAASAGLALSRQQISRLFEARGADFSAVCLAADHLRRETVGDVVRYVVNRNINYTNICLHKCTFCAFSKGRSHDDLRGPAYDLPLEEVSRRVAEAWQRGATEVCMQGGIHPRYSGETYLALIAAAKAGAPDIHIHAFSALEIQHGAMTLGMSIPSYLLLLKDAGLSTLPGTAAEILDDDVRKTLCPDKLNTDQWLSIVASAHELGLRSTATIMFGHMERVQHWATHLLHIRALQERTHGITEFVPLPFVSMEAPLYRKGHARPGPTFREALLMHAVSRLVLHPLIPNIQVSWVKMGEAGVRACLNAGANDLGGTLMNESISRSAGAGHGEEWSPAQMERVIVGAQRQPQQRTTLYGVPDIERRRRALTAKPLLPIEGGSQGIGELRGHSCRSAKTASFSPSIRSTLA